MVNFGCSDLCQSSRRLPSALTRVSVASRGSLAALADTSCLDMADDICACSMVAPTKSQLDPLPRLMVLGKGQVMKSSSIAWWSLAGT